jgi:hypothetical protein
LVVTLSMGVAIFVLPASVSGTGVSSRLVPIFLWCVLLLPKPRFEIRLSRVAMGLALVLGVGYAVEIDRAMVSFDRREVQPVLRLLRQLPVGARVECVNVCAETGDTVFVRRPMCHGCAGLASSTMSALFGGGFATLPFNPIRYRDNQVYPVLAERPWSSHPYLRYWDYVLQRGAAHWEHGPQVERVAVEEPVQEGAGRWTLYRVRSPVAEFGSSEAVDQPSDQQERGGGAQPVDHEAELSVAADSGVAAEQVYRDPEQGDEAELPDLDAEVETE